MMGTNYHRGSMLDLSGAECLVFLSFLSSPHTWKTSASESVSTRRAWMTDSDLSPPDGPLSANSIHIVIQLRRWDIFFFVHFLRSSAPKDSEHIRHLRRGRQAIPFRLGEAP